MDSRHYTVAKCHFYKISLRLKMIDEAAIKEEIKQIKIALQDVEKRVDKLDKAIKKN